MIVGFPVPNDDEIVWSVQGRYADRLRCQSQRDTLRDIFGSASILPAVALPSHLRQFTHRLPNSHPASAQSLLIGHTCYPWYAPFLPPERLGPFQECFLGNGGGNAWKTAGVSTGHVNPPRWLRFCPECLRSDHRESRVLHWRRIHQFTGIDVCAEHHVFLEDSEVEVVRRSKTQRFELPRSSLLSTEARPCDSDNLHRLAMLARHLLSREWPSHGLDGLRARYVHFLTELGYRIPGTRLRLRFEQLLAKISEFYPDELLSNCGCDGDDWLARIVREKGSMQPPIRHLLLLAFMRIPLDQFFGPLRLSQPKAQPVTSTPPNQICVNPICATRGKSTAAFVREEPSLPLHDIVELFCCDSCGQLQARRKSGKGKCWIRDYGFLWKRKLTEMWNSRGISLHKIARTLGGSCDLVVSQSIKLRLTMRRPGKRRTATRRWKHLLKSKAERLASKIERWRIKWLTTRSRYPDLNLRKLRAHCPAVYASLFRYDREWLRRNQPVGMQWWPKGKPKKDWAAEDDVVCLRLKEAAVEFRRSKPGELLPPITLARAAGLTDWTTSRLDKLPKSRWFLVRAADTTLDSAFRHCRRMADEVLFCRWKSSSSFINVKSAPKTPVFAREGQLIMIAVKPFSGPDNMLKIETPAAS